MGSKKEIIVWRIAVWGVILSGLSLTCSSLYNLSYDFRPLIIGISVSLTFILSACLSSLHQAIINSLFILLGALFGEIIFSGTVVIVVFPVGYFCLDELERK
jgi:hypothetical protein